MKDVIKTAKRSHKITSASEYVEKSHDGRWQHPTIALETWPMRADGSVMTSADYASATTIRIVFQQHREADGTWCAPYGAKIARSETDFGVLQDSLYGSSDEMKQVLIGAIRKEADKQYKQILKMQDDGIEVKTPGEYEQVKMALKKMIRF